MKRANNFIDDDAQTRLMMLFQRGETLSLPEGTVLFKRGTVPAGAWLINFGAVDILVTDTPEREISPRVAGPGELLGLDAVFSDRLCEFTAVVSTPARLDFVSRDRLLEALRGDPALFLAALQLLSRDIVAWYDAVRDSRETPARMRVR